MIRINATKRLAGGLFVLAALLTPVALRAEADMARLIPADAAFALWTTDLAGLQEASKQSAFGQLMADPASAKLVAFIESAIEEQKAEMTEEEIARITDALDSLKGGAAFYMSVDPNNPVEGDPLISIVAELDETGKEWFDRLKPEIGKDLTDVTKSTITVGETTVFQVKGLMPAESTPTPTPAGDPLFLDGTEETTEPDPIDATSTPTTINYAVVADRFLYMSSLTDEKLISDQVALLNGANTQGLQTRTDAAGAATHFEANPAAVNMFLNAQKLIDTAITEGDTGEIPDLRTKLASIGATDVMSLYGTVSFRGPDMITRVDVTLPEGTRGIMDALFAANTVTTEQLAAVPADAHAAGVFFFDFARFWDSVLVAVETFNPGASAFVTMATTSVQSQYGVDPLNSILKNIKGTHFSYTPKPAPITDAATAEDPVAVMQNNPTPVVLSYTNGVETLNAIRTLFGNLKKDPNYGETFELEDTPERITLRLPESLKTEGQPAPVVAFTTDGIHISQTEDGMSDLKRTLAGEQPAKLGDLTEFQATLPKINREGLLAFSYTSSGAWAGQIDQLRLVLGATAGDEGAEFIEALPPGEIFSKYMGTAYQTVNRSEKALVLEWTLEGKK